jgi:hypothetical protein
VAAISPCFQYKLTVGIVQRQKYFYSSAGGGINPSAGGRNPPKKNKSIELGRNCSSSAERTKNLGAPNGNQEIQFPSHLPLVLLGLSFFALIMLGSITLTSK